MFEKFFILRSLGELNSFDQNVNNLLGIYWEHWTANLSDDSESVAASLPQHGVGMSSVISKDAEAALELVFLESVETQVFDQVNDDEEGEFLFDVWFTFRQVVR